MTSKQKFTIAPIDWDLELENLSKPFDVFNGATVQSVKDKLTKSSFDLWQPYVAEDERSKLAEMSFAVVHPFTSEGSRSDYLESQDLVRHVFHCLRVIRPTRARFVAIQYELEDDGRAYVLRFTNPNIYVINMPESEVLNRVRTRDLFQLRKLMPAFVKVSADGPHNLHRAMQYYEAGYAELREPRLQFLIWMMGVEAAFRPEKSPIQDEEELKNKIMAETGACDIYEDSAERDLYAVEPLLVGSLLEDMFSLRNELVHGGGIPDDFLRREVRKTVSGHNLNHIDLLRECASFVLRTRLLSQLSLRI
jgi:hypothetical protein